MGSDTDDVLNQEIMQNSYQCYNQCSGGQNHYHTSQNQISLKMCKFQLESNVVHKIHGVLRFFCYFYDTFFNIGMSFLAFLNVSRKIPLVPSLSVYFLQGRHGIYTYLRLGSTILCRRYKMQRIKSKRGTDFCDYFIICEHEIFSKFQ